MLNGAGQISAVVRTAGPMARTAELAGDRCRVAAAELNPFLDQVRDGEGPALHDELGEGWDAVLF